MPKQKKFNKICRDIKSIRIQGAENIAKAGFFAYKLVPTKASKKKLLKLRPTEPMLQNVLELGDKMSYIELKMRLDKNQEAINKEVYRLIRNNSVIFTHCHSSTVVQALAYAKKQGKKFEVYNTETRPLFQGRKTFKELRQAGIKTTMFTDSAIEIALTKAQDKEEKTRPVNVIFLGADAITNKGVINKVGSGLVSDIAKINKIPLYIIADSLKYTRNPPSMEQRNPKEIWNKINILKTNSIKNPAFELIKKQNITGIISEFGTLAYDKFLKRVRKN